MSTINYVVGFLFSDSRDRVALIEKKKPDWQRGKLNGIGGKMEGDELPLDAMCREFKEETGADVWWWQPFCVLNFRGGAIHFFQATGDIDALESMEAEVVTIVAVADLPELRTIPNLRWLIPLALDKGAVTAVVEDNS